jgi:hypothetical protein
VQSIGVGWSSSAAAAGQMVGLSGNEMLLLEKQLTGMGRKVEQ